MKRKLDPIFFLVPIALDIGLIAVSFSVAYWLRFESGLIPVMMDVPRFDRYASAILFAALVWVFLFYFAGLYDTKKSHLPMDELYEILKSTIVGAIIVASPAFFYRGFLYSRLTFAIGCTLSIVLIFVGKILMRVARMALYKRGIGVYRAAIVGKSRMVEEVLSNFSRNPVLGYNIVGEILEQKGDKPISSLRVMGEAKDMKQIVKDEALNMLIIASPLREQERVTKILLACTGLPIGIRFVPDPYEMVTSRISFYEIGGVTLMGLKEFPLSGWNRGLKRAMDIAISSIILLVTCPILLLVAVCIKMTSRGPVLFQQERVGLGNQKFLIHKFRTMYVGADDMDQEAGLGIENDPRRTRIGVFLRRTGIDELPQLLNVLKGEMSLVGPRPERTFFVKEFSERIFRYVERHRVRPGITGWAQVNGFRGDTSIKERAKYDLYYIENWSVGFDVKVLARTLGTITGREKEC